VVQKMTIYLLNHFSLLGLVALIIGGTTTVAIIITVLVHKLLPNLHNSAFEEVTEVLRADIFALLYTIVLALVIADLSGNLKDASSKVSEEASALSALARAAPAFPPGPRASIREAIDEYVHAVVEDEWPKMKVGEQSPRAFAALEGLYATVRGFEPNSQTEQAFYSAAVDDLRDITLSRRERLQQSAEGLSSLMRTLLVTGGIVFIILAFPASARSLRTRAVIVGAATAFVSFAYLLTMVLDYPYAGDISVDNSPYKTGALTEFWALHSTPRPLVPDKFEKLSAPDLIGVWISDSSFGEAVFRQVGTEIRGAYRYNKGTVVGTVSPDGVFHGWWCGEESRKPPQDAGEIEWRLLKNSDGEKRLDGRWRYGANEPLQGGWDLIKLAGKAEPPDLAAMFDDSPSFCRHP
jgi:hypothetical protein